jgi:hypothetical protein
VRRGEVPAAAGVEEVLDPVVVEEERVAAAAREERVVAGGDGGRLGAERDLAAVDDLRPDGLG